ncbi:MAG: hypothetical protein ACTSX6_10000 [Candidatus Heimdallarchaeaceae archaeon]
MRELHNLLGRALMVMSVRGQKEAKELFEQIDLRLKILDKLTIDSSLSFLDKVRLFNQLVPVNPDENTLTVENLRRMIEQCQ